jgi:hypothetical protein
MAGFGKSFSLASFVGVACADDAGLQSAVEEFMVGLYQDNRYKTGEGIVKTPQIEVRSHALGGLTVSMNLCDG